MRSPENEAVVLAMWEGYDREGLPGILRSATDDAHWLPHSADGRTLTSTAAYREHVEEATARGVHRVRDGKVCWTGSSPDLGALLAHVGLGDRRFANEALMGLH